MENVLLTTPTSSGANSMCTQPLIVVDVGNTRIKAARVALNTGNLRLLKWEGTATSQNAAPCFDAFACLATEAPTRWWLGSVCRAAESAFRDWLANERPHDSIHLLRWTDFPIRVATLAPERTGVDRIAAATAANALRGDLAACVVVDVGTFIKVDWITASEGFCGGAILPGPTIAARGMHAYSERLPLIEHDGLTTAPPALGRDTEGAMRSGLFWGSVGAIRELLARYQKELAQPVGVYFTGGAASDLQRQVDGSAEYHPHLVLHGLALAAHHLLSKKG